MTATCARIFPRVAKAANIHMMTGGARERLTESLVAFRAVFANPDLRRIELALTGSITGEWAYAIALAVYAFDRGGAAAVGIVGLIRFLPAAVSSPFAAMLGDQDARRRGIFVPFLWLIGAVLPAKHGSRYELEQQTRYRMQGAEMSH